MTTIKTNFSDMPHGLEYKEGQLFFHGTASMDVIRHYGTPLRLFYLPSIEKNINRVKHWFSSAIKKHNYPGKYHYAYTTKSSHFKFILDEVIKQSVHLETSHENDLKIIEKLNLEEDFKKNRLILCNGYKSSTYRLQIMQFHKDGFNVVPILDSDEEADAYLSENKSSDKPINIGIRIATEEKDDRGFKYSRLGVRVSDVKALVEAKVAHNSQVQLKMLHFFTNKGMGTHDFWDSLNACLKLYGELKLSFPQLDSINIGGGLHIAPGQETTDTSQQFFDTLIEKISIFCGGNRLPYPDIYTEFGSYTLINCGLTIYQVIGQKRHGDEVWNFIDGSIMNTLPDTWGLKKRFPVYPLNNQEKESEKVNLGGITCDIDDRYTEEQHGAAIFLPKYDKEVPLYIGFFNTAAYQDALSGYGGYQHCLIPSPRIVIKDKKGSYREFRSQENHSQLRILGY